MTVRTPTALEFALLGLLHQQPRSGYDLRKVFETTAMGSYSGSPGAIYPALRRLERQELIRGEVDSSKELRPRKVFQPTAKGKTMLRQWLRREIHRQDVERGFDELMLRFAFHYLLGSDAATRRFLDSLLRQVEAYIEELRRQAGAFPEQTPLQPRLALAAGIEQYRARARWAREALRQFEEEQA
jgi:DNA-binding PadR family transcriptional regulator